MDKEDIVEVLESIAVLLELKGENPFKIRAYASGARALETSGAAVADLIESGELAKTKGIGEALAKKIETLHREGSLPFYDDLKASVEPGLLEILEIPGLGAKKVKVLHRELGIDSIDALKSACEAGKVSALKGFGKKTEEKILSGIENRAAYAARHLLWELQDRVHSILAGLRKLEVVGQAEVAGSFRRLAETVGDLDFIVASETPEPVMEWFVQQPEVVEVTAHGTTKSSVRFAGGLQADLRVVPAAQFAFALHHFTGSKDHNVAMRQRALKAGLSLSEWGFEAKDDEAADLPEIRSEEALFAQLDLPFIPPELREGRGELEVERMPELVSVQDLRGVFHNHTTASDGRGTIAQMAAAAAAKGWEYLGLADHSKASYQANGLDEARVREQIKAVRAYNASEEAKLHVFAGIECDILADGQLDLADDVLAELDYVVASVHSGFTKDRAETTARIIRAIEHPATTMLGHPTGRLLLKREGYAVDLEAVIEAAIKNEVIIEINANPRRLDLDWRFWRRAAERGLLASINPDAHRGAHFDFVDAGIHVARKGWLTKDAVLNTRSLEEVTTWLAERKDRRQNLKEA